MPQCHARLYEWLVQILIAALLLGPLLTAAQARTAPGPTESADAIADEVPVLAENTVRSRISWSARITHERYSP